MEILQGRKFSIKSENESDKIVDQISRDSKLFNIRLDQDVRLGYCNTVRPVIKNSLGESSCLGPEFAGILSVEQSFSQLQPVNTADIPVRHYYKSLDVLDVSSITTDSAFEYSAERNRKSYIIIIKAGTVG